MFQLHAQKELSPKAIFNKFMDFLGSSMWNIPVATFLEQRSLGMPWIHFLRTDNVSIEEWQGQIALNLLEVPQRLSLFFRYYFLFFAFSLNFFKTFDVWSKFISFGTLTERCQINDLVEALTLLLPSQYMPQHSISSLLNEKIIF